jgi:plasmid stabilization system protein ParE
MYSRRGPEPISTKSGTTAPSAGVRVAPSVTFASCGGASSIWQPTRIATVDDATRFVRDYEHPVGSHVLFYRLTDDGIDVVRILHNRMDFERHL